MLEYKFMPLDFTCEIYSVTCLIWLLFVAGVVRTNKQGAGQTNEKHNAQGKSGHVSRPDLAHPNPSSVSLQIVYNGWCCSRPNFCRRAVAVLDSAFVQGLALL